MDSWRTTAYCMQGHGVQRMQVIKSIGGGHARGRDGQHVVGFLECGDGFSVVSSVVNVEEIKKLRVRLHPVVVAED